MRLIAKAVSDVLLSFPVTAAGAARLYITKGINKPPIIRKGKRKSPVSENY